MPGLISRVKASRKIRCLELCGRLRCGCFPCGRHEDEATVVEDNCCQCNYAALRKMVDVAEVEVIYATFHVDVGETPFFVALDYTKKKVSRVSSLIRMHRTAFARETANTRRIRDRIEIGPLGISRCSFATIVVDNPIEFFA